MRNFTDIKSIESIVVPKRETLCPAFFLSENPSTMASRFNVNSKTKISYLIYISYNSIIYLIYYIRYLI